MSSMLCKCMSNYSTSKNCLKACLTSWKRNYLSQHIKESVAIAMLKELSNHRVTNE